MRFLALSLENFMDYSTETTMKFGGMSEKPLSTFIGGNGDGKSTLLLALVWALYGDEGVKLYAKNRPFAPRDNFDLINANARHEDHPFMKVSLELEHDSLEYELVRSATSRSSHPTDYRDMDEHLMLTELGSRKNILDPQRMINDILPLSELRYFFFDSEDIANFANPSRWEVKHFGARERALVDEEASKFFCQIVGDISWRGVTMEDEHIWLLDAGRNKIMARGTYLYIAALSFIFGFNRRVNRAAPVVIDSLLARLDLEERMKMIDNLYQFSEQVIALFLDSEIGEGSIKSRISSLSSVQYDLHSDSPIT